VIEIVDSGLQVVDGGQAFGEFSFGVTNGLEGGQGLGQMSCDGIDVFGDFSFGVIDGIEGGQRSGQLSCDGSESDVEGLDRYRIGDQQNDGG
jgi:hypothetical protein